MTKEECIADLKSINATGMECIDYAIKALEQQSDDCVSRQAVLEMIEQIQNAGGFIGYNTYSEAFDRVDNMPPVTLTQKWNLISEYEPPRDRQLMFCNNQGSVFISQVTYRNEYCSYVGKHGYFSSTVGENTGNIIAWAELPKPYEEKRGDSNGSN